MRFLAILSSGVLAALASAQGVVLPASAELVGGSSANSFPWAINTTAWPGLRIMSIYDSTNFTSASTPVNYPISILRVRWRANDVAATTSWTGGTYNQAQIGIGTAAVDHTAASTTWTSNIGPDYNIAYSGPVTVLPGVGAGVGVPGPYVVDVQLTTPFFYDPSLGDLVIDTDYTFPGNWGGGTQIAMDTTAVNPLARRVYSSSLYPNANGVDSAAPVIEIVFVPASGGTVLATNTTLGAGCVRQFASFYENFATAAAFDLANTAVTMIPSGTGHVVIQSGAFLPVGSTATPVSLVLTDDSEVTVPFTTGVFPGWTGVTVCSNGFVSKASGNGTGFTPAAGTFLAGPQDWISLGWHDFNPAAAGSGAVKIEESPGVTVITWDGVYDFGGTSAANASTMQLQLYSNGIITMAWGTMSTLGIGFLTGYSPGGNSADPGSFDISGLGAGALTLTSPDTLPLALGAGNRPVTGTNWNLNVTNVPATGTLGIDIFGLSDPGINDLFFLGAPTCGLRASLDIMNAWIVAGSAHGYSLPIPNNPALVNFHVYTTSAVFQPGVNAFGAITANGVDGKVGDY